MKIALTPKFQQIDELLKNAQRILIASHENPDLDAAASVLALHHFFKERKLESLPFFPDQPPRTFSFLPGFFEIRTEIGTFQPDLLFCLDYGDFKRLGLPTDSLGREVLTERVITIDHHLISDQQGRVRVIDPRFSSTSEIVYYWLKYKGVEFDKDLATCLLAGIFSDSGGFRHVCTSPKTLKIASELLLSGGSLSKVVRQTSMFKRLGENSLIWGRILSKMKFDQKTGLAYAWIDYEEFKKWGARLSQFGGITNLISSGSHSNLGLFLVEHKKGIVKGSLRSEPEKGKNVAKVAEALGGGGHQYAAGFQIRGTIEEALKKVLNLLAL
jgi:phosphoesterase RecJ-like protein